MLFCPYCGTQLSDDAKFCTKCGKHTTPHDQPSQNEGYSQNVPPPINYLNQTNNFSNINALLAELSAKEKVAGIIWIVIACIQILAAVLINSVALVVLICGAWNIYAGYTRLKQSKRVLAPWPSLVNAYDKWLSKIIINIIINVLIGGVIGVIGAIYDLFLRNFVLTHKNEFNSIENVNQVQYAH